MKIARMCASTVFGLRHEPVRDRLVGPPSAISPSTSRSRSVSSASGSGSRGRRSRRLTIVGIHDGLALGHALQGIGQHGDVRDPVLEQVADRSGASASSRIAYADST